MSAISSILGALSPMLSQIFGSSFTSQLGSVPGLPGYSTGGQTTGAFYPQQMQGGWYGNPQGNYNQQGYGYGQYPTGFGNYGGYNPYYGGYYGGQYPTTPPFIGGNYPNYPGVSFANPLYTSYPSAQAADYALTRLFGFSKQTIQVPYGEGAALPPGTSVPAVMVNLDIYTSPAGQQFRLQTSGYGYYTQVRAVPYTPVINNPTNPSSDLATLKPLVEGKSLAEAETALAAAGYQRVAILPDVRGLIPDSPTTYLYKNTTTNRTLQLQDGGYRAPNDTGVKNLTDVTVNNSDLALNSAITGASLNDVTNLLVNTLGFAVVNNVASDGSVARFTRDDGRTVTVRAVNSSNLVTDATVTGGTTTGTGTTEAQLRARLINENSSTADAILRNELGFQASYPPGGWGPVTYHKDGMTVQLVTDYFSGTVRDLRITGGTPTGNGSLPADISQGFSFTDQPGATAQQQLHRRMDELGYRRQGTVGSYSYVKDGRVYVAYRDPVTTAQYPPRATYRFTDMTGRIPINVPTTTPTSTLPVALQQPFRVLTGGFVPTNPNEYAPQGFTRITFDSDNNFIISENATGRQFRAQVASSTHPYTTYTFTPVLMT